MKIYWDNLTEAGWGSCEAMLSALIERGLEYVSAPDDSEISISFVGRDEIRGLNHEYRGINKETDVLSFAFTQPDEWPDVVPGQPLALGDIIICTDIAREQADTYGHTLGRELGFLTVHGLLHLAGYDHLNPEEESAMRKAQREILGELK